MADAWRYRLARRSGGFGPWIYSDDAPHPDGVPEGAEVQALHVEPLPEPGTREARLDGAVQTIALAKATEHGGGLNAFGWVKDVAVAALLGAPEPGVRCYYPQCLNHATRNRRGYPICDTHYHLQVELEGREGGV